MSKSYCGRADCGCNDAEAEDCPNMEQEHPCATGCQLAKDFGMPEASCNGCAYDEHKSRTGHFPGEEE
jgi:hypothetical protein